VFAHAPSTLILPLASLSSLPVLPLLALVASERRGYLLGSL